MTRGKPLAEREVHVLEIGACAMEKDDRERIFRATAPHFNHMLTEAVTLDKAAAWPMRPLDQISPDERHDGADTQDDSDNCDRGHGLCVVLSPMAVPRIPAHA